jgi:hypothetical protein
MDFPFDFGCFGFSNVFDHCIDIVIS